MPILASLKNDSCLFTIPILVTHFLFFFPWRLLCLSVRISTPDLSHFRGGQNGGLILGWFSLTTIWPVAFLRQCDKTVVQYSLDNGNLDNGKNLENGKKTLRRNFLALLFNKNTSILEIFKNWKPRKWKKFEKNSLFLVEKWHFLRNFWLFLEYFSNIFPQLFFVIGKWWRNSPITMFLTTTTLCHIAWHLSVSFKMPSGALWSSLEHSISIHIHTLIMSNNKQIS